MQTHLAVVHHYQILTPTNSRKSMGVAHDQGRMTRPSQLLRKLQCRTHPRLHDIETCHQRSEERQAHRPTTMQHHNQVQPSFRLDHQREASRATHRAQYRPLLPSLTSDLPILSHLPLQPPKQTQTIRRWPTTHKYQHVNGQDVRIQSRETWTI